jgi:branched-chain amino acid transport system permease protein
MAYFTQQLINAITLGAIYGLIAIGYTMVYGIIGMINFAHGDVFMIGALHLAHRLHHLRQPRHQLGAHRLIVVLAWPCVDLRLRNWAIERTAYRPLRGSFRLAPLISAIGMSIVPAELRPARRGRASQAGPQVVPAASISSRPTGSTFASPGCRSDHRAGDRRADGRLHLGDREDLTGRQQRACAGHEDGGAAGGRRRPDDLADLRAGAALAAVGVDVVLGVSTSSSASCRYQGLHRGGAGIGSLPGAMLGGLLIGLIEVFWAGYFSANTRTSRPSRSSCWS